MIIKRKKTSTNTDTILPKAVEKEAEPIIEETAADTEFDFMNTAFEERAERRRGNRRRGYRRIDDRKLVSRAQEEAITIREQASKEGFQSGLEMAHAEIEKIKQSIIDIANVRDEVYKEVSADILDISLAIAKKIIKKEINEDKNVLLQMIIAAINECGKNESRIVIKVSQTDMEFVKINIPEISAETQGDGKIHVMYDSNISENNVIIETTNGVIDLSFETQLSVLKEMFKTV